MSIHCRINNNADWSPLSNCDRAIIVWNQDFLPSSVFIDFFFLTKIQTKFKHNSNKPTRILMGPEHRGRSPKPGPGLAGTAGRTRNVNRTCSVIPSRWRVWANLMDQAGLAAPSRLWLPAGAWLSGGTSTLAIRWMSSRRRFSLQKAPSSYLSDL